MCSDEEMFDTLYQYCLKVILCFGILVTLYTTDCTYLSQLGPPSPAVSLWGNQEVWMQVRAANLKPHECGYNVCYNNVSESNDVAVRWAMRLQILRGGPTGDRGVFEAARQAGFDDFGTCQCYFVRYAEPAVSYLLHYSSFLVSPTSCPYFG